MTSEWKISVCIPFYNVEPYVRRCLNSITQNTYRNLEIICVNDGSTDGTLSILKEFERLDPRVVLIDKPNGGVVSARNAAMEVASGDYIAFVDGDDWVHRQYFEALMVIREKSNADVVICGYMKTEDVVDEGVIKIDDIEYSECDFDYISKNSDARRLIWGRIFAKKMLPHLRIDPGISFGEDAILNILFLCTEVNPRIVILNWKLYYYYHRSGSLTCTEDHANILYVCEFLIKNIDKFKHKNAKNVVLHEILKAMFSYRFIETFADNYAEVRKKCREIYIFCRKTWKSILPIKDRTRYSLLYYFPFVYCVFRILKDPTMLTWYVKGIKKIK